MHSKRIANGWQVDSKRMANAWLCQWQTDSEHYLIISLLSGCSFLSLHPTAEEFFFAIPGDWHGR